MGLAATVSNSTLTRMRAAAESLVIRARAGDQNAIAMISRIRVQVPGSRRAALAYDLLLKYIKSHPVTALFGGIRLTSKAAALRGVAAASRAAGATEYVRVVRWIERLPTSLDYYAEAACLVADGRNVDQSAVRAVLPALRGNVGIVGGEAVSLSKISGEDHAELGFQVGGKLIPSSRMFEAAFVRAVRADLVQQLAGPLPGFARQPIRVGYVLGLAKVIQDVTRRGRPIGQLSELAGWELGE